MTTLPASTPMTDDQVTRAYYLVTGHRSGAEYGEFFADLVAATERPWREVAAIIGATEEDLVEGGVDLAECE